MSFQIEPFLSSEEKEEAIRYMEPCDDGRSDSL